MIFSWTRSGAIVTCGKLVTDAKEGHKGVLLLLVHFIQKEYHGANHSDNLAVYSIFPQDQSDT